MTVCFSTESIIQELSKHASRSVARIDRDARYSTPTWFSSLASARASVSSSPA
jgi:hypothetical protein